MYITGTLQHLLVSVRRLEAVVVREQRLASFNLQSGQENAAGTWVMLSPQEETPTEVPLTLGDC